MNFSTITLSHFNNPKNVGRIVGHSNVNHTIFGSPESHFIVSFDFQIEKDFVKDAKFKAYGGVNAIAGASFLTQYSLGMNVADLRSSVDISFLISKMNWSVQEMPVAISLVSAFQKNL